MEGKKILIVDDEAEVLEIVKNKFAEEGYEVCSELTGEEAVRKAKVFKPDLILLDIMLSDMDGPEVVKKIQLDPETAVIPLIFFSGIVTKEDDLGNPPVVKVGNKSYPAIGKPFTFRDLLILVEEELEKSES